MSKGYVFIVHYNPQVVKCLNIFTVEGFVFLITLNKIYFILFVCLLWMIIYLIYFSKFAIGIAKGY